MDDLERRLSEYGRAFDAAVADIPEIDVTKPATLARRRPSYGRFMVGMAAVVLVLVVGTTVLVLRDRDRGTSVAAGGGTPSNCNALDPLLYPNAVVRFTAGTFASADATAINRVAQPLRTLDFRVQDTVFAPDPHGPKGQLEAFVRFSDDARAADLTSFLDNARHQSRVIDAEKGSCPLAGGSTPVAHSAEIRTVITSLGFGTGGDSAHPIGCATTTATTDPSVRIVLPSRSGECLALSDVVVELHKPASARAVQTGSAAGAQDWAVKITLTTDDGHSFLAAAGTAANQHSALAIIVDGRVVATPTVQPDLIQNFTGSLTITGAFDRQEADAIAADLNALP